MSYFTFFDNGSIYVTDGNTVEWVEPTEENLQMLGIETIPTDQESCPGEGVGGTLIGQESHLIEETIICQESCLSDSSLNKSTTEANTSVDSSRECVAKWSDDSSRCLIDLYEQNYSLFQSNTMKNDDVWDGIQKKMQEAGYSYKTEQIKTKWKNLKKAYMQWRDSQKTSGAPAKTFKFAEEFDAVFATSPAAEPLTIVSSMRKRSHHETSSHEDKENESEEEDDPAGTSQGAAGPSSQPKKNQTRVQKELGSWAKQLRNDSQQREENRERRHKEVLTVFADLNATQNRAANVFQDVMNRLIDTNCKA